MCKVRIVILKIIEMFEKIVRHLSILNKHCVMWKAYKQQYQARRMEQKGMSRKYLLPVLGILVLVALVVSGIEPYDRVTWLLEVAPILIAAPILLLTYRRFPLTTLIYVLICLHALVLILGGIYTYARVPLGFWLQEFFDLARNPYDKIGHFMQGFVPALIAREILLRGKYVSNMRMAAFLSVCVALAFSAFYELVEWWTALALGQGAEEFLGTQGDPWDTQSDMFMALFGAAAAMLVLARLHDRRIEALDASPPATAHAGGTNNTPQPPAFGNG
jgi:putative membrane protein